MTTTSRGAAPGPIAVAARYGLVLWVLSLLAWFVATVLGVSASSVSLAVLLRTVLGLMVLALVTVRARRRATPGTLALFVIAGATAYLLHPAALSGRLLVGQFFTDPGWVTWAIDLVLWLAVVVLVSARVVGQPAAERTPYGAMPASP